MTAIKRIDSIEVRNVKGLENKKFESLSIIPNKPTLVVAPNGFGKSSIAAGFAAMNRKRIDLPKEHCHKGDESKVPKVSISYTLEDNTVQTREADSSSNDISEVFDIFVINSQLVPKAKQLKISGASIVTASLEVKPIVLIAKVPDKAIIKYSFADAKKAFGKNGKVLPNIKPLLDNKSLMVRMAERVDFSKHTRVAYQKAVESFRNAINESEGTTSQILSVVASSYSVILHETQLLAAIVEVLKEQYVPFDDELAYYLSAMQIIDVYASDNSIFKRAIERYEYELEAQGYEQLFSSLQGTWKNIGPHESKKEGLVVEFPKATLISNGERDAICFLALLKRAQLRFKKSHCILIIDEIFDYLDDANVVACQFYLTRMIVEMKAEGRQIFPLIMTHLSPGYFRSYYFSDQKVTYLNRVPSAFKDFEKVLQNREDPSIKDDVAKYFLHYSPQSVDLSTQFAALNLPMDLSKSESFCSKSEEHLERYFEGKKYDPLAVCCAVRRRIEERTFAQLAPELQPEFLEIHKTVEKLRFAVDHCASVPEVFFLLGIVYNEALHLRSNQDNTTPVFSKLENLTIKNMIKVAVS